MTRVPQGGALIDRTAPLSISLDGRRIPALEGDTIGSALAAASVAITGRSFKYHRPRGLYCMTGACGNCLVRVNGEPNVRACTRQVERDLRVTRQNAWPGADRDLLRIFDRVSGALPAGFYYKAFHKPRFVWPLVEPIVRRVAGLGRLPKPPARGRRNDRLTVFPDVLVIGGGRAGLTAAVEAAGAGRRTMVLEQRAELGGRLRTADPAAADRLVDAARAAGVEVLSSTPAFGVFEGPLVAAAGPHTLWRIRAGEIVFATGSLEQGAVFTNNDLPGVMLSEGVDRLLALYGVRPGAQALVVAYGSQGRATAAALEQAGAQVTVVDPARQPVLRAVGQRRVEGVVVGGPGGSARLDCDLLVLAGPRVPATSLLAQAGARLRYDASLEAYLPDELPDGMRAVGSVTGGQASIMPTAAAPSEGKQFVCLCMDVTVKEMRQAVTEGFDSTELLKRYTTLTMGPCQGKACLMSSLRLCAELTDRPLPQVDRPTARPPWTPIPLGVLAAGHLVPRKETAIHQRHVEAGAEFMWAGDWRRPHHYRDPRQECEAVHERVGLIDVSSLGKFRITGSQAVTLLERLYPSKFADLKIGRVRYGAMLNDQGVILDDGTVCRLDDQEFFVTTTTGGTSAMDQWIKWWLADWALEAHVINVSGGYAAVNLAGPRSREVMQRLTDMDVSKDALPYLMSARGELAGVPALILRIGFVGELSYEIHVPSAYGQHVWDAIMAAGQDLGIEPFGLEAQRILRLEKQHIIVGQDTDALSDPYGAGLEWMVKFEKADFLGRRSLEETRDHGSAERLVGFTVDAPEAPPEGAAVVDAGRPIGRICSSRHSDVMKTVVGMAWVPAPLAEDGKTFEIAYNGHRASARVVLRPFYDPEGTRLRS
ncbi:MAG TPA: 2Fe-2S iron-sulfur cluster-binding protein [Candidatus Dormibacteraeota bacterium]|nr:2Fe-2S iron-sulfur cluster-binding protein [Candidatus Dormibacteraeota bacterium]